MYVCMFYNFLALLYNARTQLVSVLAAPVV